MADSIDLPSPGTAALAHSARLLECIRTEIAACGPLSFDRFWELAMYAPGLGYYSAGAVKFGAAGDFVTAPELGAVFARCVATPVAAALSQLDNPEVLELGAGSGAFAAALLADLERRDQLPQRYWILERSADLRQRQQQRLGAFADRVEWLDGPPAGQWSGVVFGNEVVDALAAKRVLRKSDVWVELRVDWQSGGLCWTDGPVDASTLAALATIEGEVGQLPVGYQTELQPSLEGWVRAVTRSLRRGLVLIIDYGYPRREYYLPDRRDGTLLCHYRHRAHGDALLWPGLNDLSVSVDFTALAEALVGNHLELAGFTTQAQFLLNTGLPQQLEAANVDGAAHAALLAEIKTLTLPAEMGEHVKVIAATRDLGPPPGFAVDQRHRL